MSEKIIDSLVRKGFRLYHLGDRTITKREIDYYREVHNLDIKIDEKLKLIIVGNAKSFS